MSSELPPKCLNYQSSIELKCAGLNLKLRAKMTSVLVPECVKLGEGLLPPLVLL